MCVQKKDDGKSCVFSSEMSGCLIGSEASTEALALVDRCGLDLMTMMELVAVSSDGDAMP